MRPVVKHTMSYDRHQEVVHVVRVRMEVECLAGGQPDQGRKAWRRAGMALPEYRAMDEQKLIAAARRGDVEAFNELVLIHQGVMYNVAYRLLGDGEAAADATQEAVISAFKALRGFRGRSLKGWLLQIVISRCWDEMGSHRCYPTHHIYDDPLEADRPPVPAANATPPEEHADRRRLAQVLQQAILSLPPQQRVVVVLSDVQGLSYQEIADALHTSRGTVESRLSQARARLGDALQALLSSSQNSSWILASR